MRRRVLHNYRLITCNGILTVQSSITSINWKKDAPNFKSLSLMIRIKIMCKQPSSNKRKREIHKNQNFENTRAPKICVHLHTIRKKLLQQKMTLSNASTKEEIFGAKYGSVLNVQTMSVLYMCVMRVLLLLLINISFFAEQRCS